MTKADKVRLLLLSMDDYLLSEAVSFPHVYAAAQLGPQASLYVRCGTCSGCGRIRGADQPCMVCLTAKREGRSIPHGHGCRLCLVCDGRGERKRRCGDDSFDTYSSKTLEELGEMPTVEPPRKATIRHVSQPSERDFPWVEERKRLEAYGSYEELRRELEWLRDRHIGRYEVLMHYVSEHGNKWWSWSKEALASVNSTIDMLAERMPDPVKYPGWLRKELAA